jgi:KDO2-lipid IV(A) lauroyltransferase
VGYWIAERQFFTLPLMIFLLRFFSQWPLDWLYHLSNLAAFLAYRVVRYRRKTVVDNLKRSFPEKSVDEIHHIAEAFYRNLSDVTIETLYGRTISAEELRSRVVFEGMEPIQDYYQQNQSVIILAAHQCNWEWLLLAGCLALPFPVDAIYKRLASSRMNRFMYRIRSRFGGEPIDKDSAVRTILKRREQSRAIAMVGDQTPAAETPKIWCHFLNQNTGFYQGVEQLPKITGYPVFFAAMYRLSRGYYQVHFTQIAAPPYTEQNNIVHRYAELTEKVIRQQPANWLWSHRRWKITPPVEVSSNRV